MTTQSNPLGKIVNDRDELILKFFKEELSCY